MKFFTASSLFFGAIATVTSVVAGDLANGNYYITNKAELSGQNPLAITFNGEGKVLTVTPTSRSQSGSVIDSQAWTVTSFDPKAGTYSISPVSNTKLQAAWGNNVIDARPAGSYVWKITDSNNKGDFTIQDGGATAFWGVATAASGSDVTITKEGGTDRHLWRFKPTCIAFGSTCYDGLDPCCNDSNGAAVQCMYKDSLRTYQACGCKTDKDLCGGKNKDGTSQPPCCP